MNLESSQNFRKIHCNTCDALTNHEILTEKFRRFSDMIGEEDEGGYLWIEEYHYQVWSCRGCETVCLEEKYSNENMETYDKEGLGQQYWKSTFYPPRNFSEWQQKHFLQLDIKLATIYKELINSYDHDSRILCAIGLRALLEGICAEKRITGRNLEIKIEGLKAFLPANIVESLHKFRFMGNDAAHELQAPSREELKLAIEIVEDLLNFLYELEYKVLQLQKKP